MWLSIPYGMTMACFRVCKCHVNVLTDHDAGEDGQPVKLAPTSSQELLKRNKIKITNKFGIDLEEQWSPRKRQRIENMKQSNIHHFFMGGKTYESVNRPEASQKEKLALTREDDEIIPGTPEDISGDEAELSAYSPSKSSEESDSSESFEDVLKEVKHNLSRNEE